MSQGRGMSPAFETEEVAAPRVVAAMVTPCQQAGFIDPPAAGVLARALTDAGCDGLFVASSTGEMPLLSVDHRVELVAAVRRAVGEDTLLYAGVSGLGVSDTLAITRRLADAGADVAVAMVPFFLKLSDAELLAYFRDLADESPLPLALYHHLRMPSQISLDTLQGLADHPNFLAIKDTSRDLERCRGMCNLARRGDETHWRRFEVYQGSEAILHDSLAIGATGCVTALAGAVPEWHRELIDAWQRGDEATCRAAQQQITQLAQIFNLDAVGASFGHFAYALRRAVARRGWIDHSEGMVTGFEPTPAFDRQLDNLFDRCGLSADVPTAHDAASC